MGELAANTGNSEPQELQQGALLLPTRNPTRTPQDCLSPAVWSVLSRMDGYISSIQVLNSLVAVECGSPGLKRPREDEIDPKILQVHILLYLKLKQ